MLLPDIKQADLLYFLAVVQLKACLLSKKDFVSDNNFESSSFPPENDDFEPDKNLISSDFPPESDDFEPSGF